MSNLILDPRTGKVENLKVKLFNQYVDKDKVSPAVYKKVAIAATCQTKRSTQHGVNEVKDAFHVIRKEVPFAINNVVNILDENADKVKGLQTFKGNQLQSVAAILVTKLKVGYAADAASGKEGDLIYNADMTPFVRNSFLVVRQFGAEIARIPFTEFDSRTVGNNTEDRFYHLEKPFPIYGEEPFEIQVECPAIGTAPTTKGYLEIEAAGLQA